MADATLDIVARMTDQVTPALKKMGTGFRSFSKGLEGGISKVTKQMSSLQNIIAGAVMIKAIDSTVGAFARLESQMMQVGGLSDDISGNLKAFTNDILKLSTQTGQATEVLTKSLFDAVSAGVEAGDAMEFLATASRLAIGGATETSVAVDGLTTIINAFALETSDATDVADAFFTAQKFGKTTVAELAQNIGKVAPIAKAAGVGFGDMFAAMSALTKGGINTAEATTMLRGALTQINRLTPEATAKLQSLGLAYKVNEEAGVTLADVFDNVTKASGGTLDGMIKLIPDINAAAGILSLGADKAKVFREAIEALNNRVGSSQKAFDQMNKTMAQTTAKLSAEFTVAFIQAGAVIAPVLQDLLSSTEGNLGGIQFAFKLTAGAIGDIVNGIKLAFQGVTAWINAAIAGWSIGINAVLQALPDRFVPDGWKSSMADWTDRSLMASDAAFKSFTDSATIARERGSLFVNVLREGAGGAQNFSTSVLDADKNIQKLTADLSTDGAGGGMGLPNPEKMTTLLADINTMQDSFLLRTIEGQQKLLDEEEEFFNIRIDQTIDNELGRQEAKLAIEKEFNAKRADLVEKAFNEEEKAKKISNKKTEIIEEQRKRSSWATAMAAVDAGKMVAKAMGVSGNVLKIMAMGEVAINGARAVAAAFASPPGPPGTLPLAAFVGVKTAAQLAIIDKQKFATGGFPSGRNAAITVNEQGQEAVLNAAATSRAGSGGVNAMNNGIPGSGSTTNEIAYNPTFNITASSSDDILSALSQDREAAATFINDLKRRGF